MIVGYVAFPLTGKPRCSTRSADGGWRRADLCREDLAGRTLSGRRWPRRSLRGPGDVLLVTRLDRLARIDPGSAQCARRCRQGWRGFQIAGRYMGRHHHAARPADAECVGRPCGVRAGANQGPHRRRPQASEARGVRFGRKLKLTPHQRAEAIARREAGGPGRHRSDLQRQPLHHLTAQVRVARTGEQSLATIAARLQVTTVATSSGITALAHDPRS